MDQDNRANNAALMSEEEIRQLREAKKAAKAAKKAEARKRALEVQQAILGKESKNTEASTSQDSEITVNEQFEIRLKKLLALKAAGKDPFLNTKFNRTVLAKEIVNNFEQYEGQMVSIAGRIMSKRGMGKANFCDLLDPSCRIQIYSRVDELGEQYEEWLDLDIADQVGVTGEVMRTKRGEISIRNHKFVLLSKGLRPLPEKFHGLTDTDTRYRRRYLDLIMNPEVKETFVKRSNIIKHIREYLNDRDFLEVETPILNVIPGGGAAKPFITHHNTLDMDLYLRIAPELYLKRLIVGGFDRVYEIGRNFRNEGMSVKHNPEFTMIEIYQAYGDLYDMMDIAENMISEVCMKVNNTYDVKWNGKDISLKPPFARLSMEDSIKEYANVDFNDIKNDEEAYELARKHNIQFEPSHKRGDIMNLFFETYVESKLIQPTFIYRYPIEISHLTKRCADDPRMTERFELFIDGKEIGNAYSELNDPIDQRERFMMQLERRAKGDDEANMMDEDYCMALEYGLVPTGGLGMGIDRLCMLLTNSDSIRDVLLFPTMKPLGGAQ